MTLYETLGVEEDADAATLKAAHRRAVKEHHPDKHGGDDAKFRAVQEAYDVLKDPEKRAHYDRTGETSIDDPEAKKDREARKFASELIEMAIENIEDVDTLDLIRECVAQIDNKLVEIRGHIRKHKAADKRAEKALKRLKLKAGVEDDFLAGAIRRKREQLAKELKSMDDALDIVGRVKTIYEGYDYVVDRPDRRAEMLAGASRGAQMRPEDFDQIYGHIFGRTRR